MSAVSKPVRLVVRAVRKGLRQPGEALLLCRMAWWVGLLSAATKVWSLPRALAFVSGHETQVANSFDVELANRLAQSIDLLLAADVVFLRPICWKRAAVLRRYLSQNGIPTQIIFGVRNETTGPIDGHAWLEHAGKPFLEKTPPDYIVTFSFPANEKSEQQLAFTSK